VVNFQIQSAPALHTSRTIPDKDTLSDSAVFTTSYAFNGCRGAYAGVYGGDTGLD
jgi:hypothetical protein